MGEDGAGRAFEIGVEEVEKVLRRHGGGHFRGVPEIAVPDGGMYGLPVPPLDLAIDYLLAGVRPEIGGQDGPGRLVVDGDLKGDGQALLDPEQGMNVPVAEPRGAVRGPGSEETSIPAPLIGLLVSEADRVREVIRRAPILELLENGEIDQGVVPRQGPAQEGYAAIQHVEIGALKPSVRLPCRAMKVADGGHAFVPEPGQGHGCEKGMQGAEPDLSPPQGIPVALRRLQHPSIRFSTLASPSARSISQSATESIRSSSTTFEITSSTILPFPPASLPRQAKILPKRLATNSLKSVSSWRTKPLAGNFPSRCKSTMAQTPDAVVA